MLDSELDLYDSINEEIVDAVILEDFPYIFFKK